MSIIDGKRTLGELRKAHRTKNSFNRAMRKDAKDRYLKAGGEWKCKVCGESVAVDICHIKKIHDFPVNALIEEVNGIENLTAYCPTHHRLFDMKKKRWRPE